MAPIEVVAPSLNFSSTPSFQLDMHVKAEVRAPVVARLPDQNTVSCQERFPLGRRARRLVAKLI